MTIRVRGFKPAGILLSTLLACGGLAGCESAEPWQPPRTAQQPQLELADYRYEVEFAPGTVVLATGAQESLRLFLARVGVLPGDRVYVIAAVPATAAPQAAAPLGRPGHDHRARGPTSVRAAARGGGRTARAEWDPGRAAPGGPGARLSFGLAGGRLSFGLGWPECRPPLPVR
jgi:hypothetical protein